MDNDRAVALLKERLAELKQLQSTGPEFETWMRKAERTLRLTMGDDHELVKVFEDIQWYSLVPESHTIMGTDTAMGVLEAAIYEKEELAEPVDFASSASLDPELWAEVRHLVEQERWAQVASQTSIFVESKMRQWAGRPVTEVGERLMTAVVGENGEFPLGQTQGEKQGWHRLGMGFAMALRNVDTHRIQVRNDEKRYALGRPGHRKPAADPASLRARQPLQDIAVPSARVPSPVTRTRLEGSAGWASSTGRRSA